MINSQQIRKAVFGVGVFVPLVALLATIWVTHETNGRFADTFASLTQGYKILNILAETQRHISEAETGRRGYLLTGGNEYFELYDASMAAYNNDIQQLKILARNSPIQQDNIVQLQNLVAGRLSIDSKKTASGKNNSQDALAIELTDDGRDTMNQIRANFFKMREQESDSLTAHQMEAEDGFIFEQTAQIVMVGVTAVSLIAVMAVLLRLEKLRQIVTVCAWTGQVRHEGKWIRLEEYLKRRFGLSVSHGLSVEASEKIKRENDELNRHKDASGPDLPPV